MTLDREPLREPSVAERQLVRFLLSTEFRGVEALRDQTPTMTVASNCDCGCGSFSIHVDPAIPRSEWKHTATPSALDVERGIEVGLLTAAGILTGAEITYNQTEPAGVPDPSRFRFDWLSE